MNKYQTALQALVSEVEELVNCDILPAECDLITGRNKTTTIKRFRQIADESHDPCPVCSCNVHGRAEVILDLLSTIQPSNVVDVTRLNQARRELKDLIGLTKP